MPGTMESDLVDLYNLPILDIDRRLERSSVQLHKSLKP
jgi:hypothetical protein